MLRTEALSNSQGQKRPSDAKVYTKIDAPELVPSDLRSAAQGPRV